MLKVNGNRALTVYVSSSSMHAHTCACVCMYVYPSGLMVGTSGSRRLEDPVAEVRGCREEAHLGLD